jgi:hypothetical protein
MDPLFISQICKDQRKTEDTVVAGLFIIVIYFHLGATTALP